MLQFMGEAAKGATSKAQGSRTILAFYSVVICEVIALAPKVDEDLANVLLPYLMAGIEQGAAVSPDFRASTFMVMAQLVSHATLSSRFLKGAQ